MLCECIKNHWIVHFKRVNFLVKLLFFDKADIKKQTNKKLEP